MKYLLPVLNKFWDDIQSSSLKEFLYLICIPFFIWFLSFAPVFLGQKSLYLDANAYFHQISYFIDHLKQGIYPLWFPNSEFGMTYEFFLRRIGDGNPVYLLLAFFSFLGMSYTAVYALFLLGYFFLGVYGFYLIADQLFRDKFFSFLAYIIFLFSSFSAHLFSNYIILIFVPLIWFFYFFLRFIKDFRSWQCLGIFLSVAIGLTTYVPIIFALIVGWFFVCFSLLYADRVASFFKALCDFIKKNKMLFTGCIVFLMMALIPVAQFYIESKSKEIFLPTRSSGVMLDRSVQVADTAVNAGDVFAHGHFEKLFFNQKGMTRWEFFISYLVFLLFFVAMLAPLNRVLILLGLLSLGIMSVAGGHITPIYQWLYQHVFGVKFVRQLFYFFWVFVLPVSILFLVYAFQRLLSEQKSILRKRIVLGVYGASSFIFLMFILTRTGILWGGVLASLMSVIWVGFLLFDEQKKYRVISLLLVLFFVAFQGFELNRAMLKDFPNGSLSYRGADYRVTDKYFVRHVSLEETPSLTKIDPFLLQLSGKTHAHVASFWLTALRKNPDIQAFKWFIQYRFWLYDDVQVYDNDEEMIEKITSYWQNKKNITAFIPREMANSLEKRSLRKNVLAVPVTIETKEFKIEKVTPNKVIFHTSFLEDKFVLMTDTYSQGWKLWIDGKRSSVLRANIAFKGFWIPKGEHRIVLEYASMAQELWRFFVLGVFALITVMIFVFLWYERRLVKRGQG